MPTDANHHPLLVTNWNRNALCFHCHLYYYLRKCLNSRHPSPFFRNKSNITVNLIINGSIKCMLLLNIRFKVSPYHLSRCCYLKSLTRLRLKSFHRLRGIRRKPLQLQHRHRQDLATRYGYNFHRCR